MNPRTNDPIPIKRSLPEARQLPTERRDNEFVDLYSVGMTQALELTRLAVETSICVNACMMNFCKHMFWYPFGLEYWFEAQCKAYANLVDVGAQLARTMLPERRSFTRPEPEATPQEVAENIESVESGLDVAVETFEDEILA